MSEQDAKGAILGIDPGSAKVGYALLDEEGRVLCAGIEPVATLKVRLRELAAQRAIAHLAVGKGTRSRDVVKMVGELGLPVAMVDEFETTRRARELYFADHPPRGWRRLIPLGMQLPPRPIDDYAAILIARKFLAGRAEAPGN